MTSPVVSERNAVKPWDASMPLRADATDEQMHARLRELRKGYLRADKDTQGEWPSSQLAREYAAACAASPVLVSREPRWQDDPRVKSARIQVMVAQILNSEGEYTAELRDALDALCEAVAAPPSGASPAAPEDETKRLLHVAANMLESTGFRGVSIRKLCEELRFHAAALSPPGSAAT